MLAHTKIFPYNEGMATTEPRSTQLSDAGLQAWKGLLRAHSRLTPELDDQLRAEHGIGMGDLDVLAQLAEAPSGRLRMCDLAAAVVMSPSGLSRRVDRLERSGLVARTRGEEDGRNVEARLTPEGRRLLRRLRKTHRAGVKQRFADRFSDAELQQLAQLLGRLTG